MRPVSSLVRVCEAKVASFQSALPTADPPEILQGFVELRRRRERPQLLRHEREAPSLNEMIASLCANSNVFLRPEIDEEGARPPGKVVFDGDIGCREGLTRKGLKRGALAQAEFKNH